MVHCSVELNGNDAGIFFAGDLLKGTIVLNADKVKKYRGLYFLVYGAAECKWKDSFLLTLECGEHRRTLDLAKKNAATFRGEEIYLNQMTYLFGQKGAEAVEVPAGIHRYDFVCQLPPLAPASFEASYGHIRYKVKAVLDIPWGLDKESEVQFTIVRHDDLNCDPSLRISSRREEIKRFCCLSCQSEPLIMTVTLPYTGFVPGQVVPAEISYKNRSSTDIELTKISIKRCIRFVSDKPRHKTRKECEKQVEIRAGGVKRGEDQQFRVDITLPMTMIKSNVKICRVVQVYYELHVEAVASKFYSKSLKVSVPIEIGSVPLNFDASLHQEMVQPALNPGFAPPTAPMFDSPPSFDEASKMLTTYNRKP